MRQSRLFAAAIPWYDGAHLWISGDCLVPLDDYWLVAKKISWKNIAAAKNVCWKNITVAKNVCWKNTMAAKKCFAGKIPRSPDSLLTTIVSKSLAE